MSTVESVLESATALSVEDRLELVNRPWETVPQNRRPPLLDDPSFIAELERRDRDGSPGIPWEQIRDGSARE